MAVMIREAVPDDMAQVHEMMGLLARHHGEEATVSLETLKRRILTDAVGKILVVAEEEGLMGYALILPRPWLVNGGDGHDINHLFVVEWRRRAGIGRALIAAARDVARAEESLSLSIGTHLENLGAQRAYREMGLEEAAPTGPRFKVALQ